MRMGLWLVCIAQLLFMAACGGSDVATSTAVPLDNRTISDPYYSRQWSLNPAAVDYYGSKIDYDAHIHGAEELTRYSGKGVRIAVIDDGLDRSHEDLEGAVVATYNLNLDSEQLDALGSTLSHGTAVSGIIAARENILGIK